MGIEETFSYDFNVNKSKSKEVLSRRCEFQKILTEVVGERKSIRETVSLSDRRENTVKTERPELPCPHREGGT